MSTMRAYTREFCESTVGLVLSEGLSIRKAADDPGMPYPAALGVHRTPLPTLSVATDIPAPLPLVSATDTWSGSA